MSAPTERQKQFKKGIDAEESRRRREDTTIQIRKSKKEERLNQRRRMVRCSIEFIHVCHVVSHHDPSSRFQMVEIVQPLG